MAKQADPALEAIRKKHLAIVGKEAGATLGVKQITAAIKKFQEENPGGGDAVTDPSKEEVSNPAIPTAVDNTASLASGNDNVIVGKNGDDSISTSGGAGELKAVANYPVNTEDNSGDKAQIMDNDAFRSLAKEVTGLDIDQLKSPEDFATPREYINHLLKLMMLDVKLNSLESIGVIKFMAKFNPYPELNEALAEALAELEQDAGGLIETSRKFCREHNGNVYHISEIREFQPKEAIPPNYDPLTDLGGYGCRHSLNWIPNVLALRLRPDASIFVKK